MPSVQILAWGLLPAAAVVAWDAARARRLQHYGFVGPVSPEGVRWVQYAGFAYQLGYAALALAYIDGRGPSALLLATVGTTCLTTVLLLWHLGERHGSWTPRLTDMRSHCYLSHMAVLRRARFVSRLAFRSHGYDRWSLRADLTRSEALSTRCERQLRRLQLALTTEAFCRRLEHPGTARAELNALAGEQRRLVREAQQFLDQTQPLLQGESDLGTAQLIA